MAPGILNKAYSYLKKSVLGNKKKSEEDDEVNDDEEEEVKSQKKSDVFDRKTTLETVEIFQLLKQFQKDQDPRKINLLIGAYRNEELQPYPLKIVKEVEPEIVQNPAYTHEYESITGSELFCDLITKLVLGEGSPAITEKRVTTVQTVAGTGAMRAGAQYLKILTTRTNVYISDYSWPCHKPIFLFVGFENVGSYRYYDHPRHTLNVPGMLCDLLAMPDESIVILHGCAHNPTGLDPTKEEWMQIEKIIKKKKHLPFFDLAYQGFASGDIEADAWTIRYFVQQGHQLFIAQSCSKNFGLYNERVGALILVQETSKHVSAVMSQMGTVCRCMWSMPPGFGSRIVMEILSNPERKARLLTELKSMADRLIRVRKELRNELEKLKTPGDWSYITQGSGMFFMLPFTPEQVFYMRTRHSVYFPRNARISICGLNSGNIPYVAAAINDTIAASADNNLRTVGEVSESQLSIHSPFGKTPIQDTR